MFDRHFRGSNARAERPDGSGLGLPIAQALARAHGGRVDVDSTLGHGSNVRVWLPAAASMPLSEVRAPQEAA